MTPETSNGRVRMGGGCADRTSVDLLVIGGSGTVGGLVLPQLAEDNSIRIFDLM